MYTFLVVDDESLVRENIVFLLRQSGSYPFRILEAEDGDTAMEMLASHSVDVLLLDVRMLRVGGLQLMEWLHDISWEGKYAVISGYSNFSYVQKAIEMGAANYILKPIDEEQFFPAIDAMLASVARRKEERRIIIRYHSQRMENYWLRVERCFIKQMEHSWSASLTREQEELNREGGVLQKMCVLLCNVDPPGITREELLSSVCRRLEKTAEYPEHAGIIRNYWFDHELIVLQRSPAEDSFFIWLWEEVQQNQGKGQLSAALTTFDGGAASLAQAYRRCRELLKQRFLTGRGWITDSFRETAAEPLHFDVTETLGRFHRLLRTRNLQSFQGLRELLDGMFSLQTFAALKLDAAGELFRQITEIICEEAKTGPEKYTHVQLDHFDTSGEVADYFMELIRGLFSPEGEGGSFREFYRPICAYIAEHYPEPITLTELAQQFGFHPNYFSGAFRDMAGISFQDYVMGQRLNEAKRLLRKSELSVRQIALQVGYNSQSYFQRVFKKEEGVTPMEYRLTGQGFPV